MSWYDGVLSNTVGVLYRAASGTVDPWTLQQQKDDAAATIAQAAVDGNGVQRVDPAQVAILQAQTSSMIDENLMQQNLHPDQAGINIPGLGNIGSAEFFVKAEKIVYGLILAGSVLGVFYFSQRYGSTLKETFRKR